MEAEVAPASRSPCCHHGQHKPPAMVEANPSPWSTRCRHHGQHDVVTMVNPTPSPWSTRRRHLGQHNAVTSVNPTPSPRSTRRRHLGQHDAVTSVNPTPSPRSTQCRHLGQHDAVTSVNKRPSSRRQEQPGKYLVFQLIMSYFFSFSLFLFLNWLISLTTTRSPGCNPDTTSTNSKLESPSCTLRFTSWSSPSSTKSSYSPRPT